MRSRTFSKLTDCVWVRKRFSEYLDGALIEEERLEVHEHVKFCDSCSDELDQLCKTVSMLADFREDLPEAIQRFRLPRATFVEIFPTIRQPDREPFSISMLVPYFSALVLLLVLVSTWEGVERHSFKKHYNESNYVEVVG